MRQLQLHCYVQLRAALELARTRLHTFTLSRTHSTRSLARPLACTILHSNSLTLSTTCSRSTELFCTRLLSLVHLLARTRSNSLSLAHTCSHSLACPLVRTRSNSHTFSRTFSNSLVLCCKTIQLSLLASCCSSNEPICYVATKLCENILIVVGDVTAKRNSKECSLAAAFNCI